MGSISLSVPQIGAANATEDVKVANDFTTIQTWANGNVDTVNISPTAGIKNSQLAAGVGQLIPFQPAGSVTAQVGQQVIAAPGATITLPTVAAGAIVGVQAQSTVTGASPVTIASQGGVWIYGLGIPTAVTSILLGAPNAALILQYNASGNIWQIVSGQQDSGWIAMSLGANVGDNTALSDYPPAARLIGDRVIHRGLLGNSANIAAGATVWTAPALLRPSGARVNLLYMVAQQIGGGAASGLLLQLQTGIGAVSLSASGPNWAAATSLLSLHSLVYPII